MCGASSGAHAAYITEKALSISDTEGTLLLGSILKNKQTKSKERMRQVTLEHRGMWENKGTGN